VPSRLPIIFKPSSCNHQRVQHTVHTYFLFLTFLCLEKGVRVQYQPVLRIRIRNPVPFDPWIRDPGWVKKIKIRIRDEHPGSYFQEL
jgi:hypothetical protein